MDFYSTKHASIWIKWQQMVHLHLNVDMKKKSEEEKYSIALSAIGDREERSSIRRHVTKCKTKMAMMQMLITSRSPSYSKGFSITAHRK